jgi:pimeloyl-ACP methyl ester carboxylesterase
MFMKYVLIPGAGGVAWNWSRVLPHLRTAGHDVAAVDLPGDDESAGLTEYAQLVEQAIGHSKHVILVAQSLGGFTAPLAAAHSAVREIVFVNAMIPVPGETPGSWWENTGWESAHAAAAVAGGYSTEFSDDTDFFHDVSPDVIAEGEMHQRMEANAAFESTCDFLAWPQIPIRVLAGADDRFFPYEFQRRVAHDRLGIETDAVHGGHLVTLSNPRGVADYLLGG